MPGNSNKLCGKVIHLTDSSANVHVSSLKDRYGKGPNKYLCERCSEAIGQTVIHVGYGYDSSLLSKRARRHRKQVGSRKRKRARRWQRELLSQQASEA